MDGCRFFEVCIDGVQVKSFSWETVNSYFINQGYTKNKTSSGTLEYWSEFWTLLEKYPLKARTEYTDKEFCEALEQYRNQKIHDSIFSSNALVRMFAILDRRIGKRTLERIKLMIDEQPDWLRTFYRLRLNGKNIFEA